MRARASDSVNIWHPLVAAFQLLSRFPFPVQVPFEAQVLKRSLVFYPLVGLAIGLTLAGAGAGLSAVLPVPAAAAFLTALWIGITGGLHMDGLMDTADGLLSHRSRERMLEIMKDSRVGAMGVMACALQVLFKFALLSSLLEHGWLEGIGMIATVPVWSRWFMVAAITAWPYAREGQGMGSLLAGAGPRHLLGCSLMAAALSIPVLMLPGTGIITAALLTSAAVLASGCIGTLIAVRIAGKLGGLTGDTYGAVNELVETGLLLAAVLYLTH